MGKIKYSIKKIINNFLLKNINYFISEKNRARIIWFSKRNISNNFSFWHHFGLKTQLKLSPNTLKNELISGSAKLLNYSSVNSISPKQYCLYWGNWVDSIIPIEKHHSFIFVKEILNGILPKHTLLWQELILKQKKKIKYWDVNGNLSIIKSLNDLQFYASYIIKLAENIQKNGYISVYDKRIVNNRPIGYEETEIGVCVDTKGFLFFKTGHHRLAIIKILNIKTQIPCTIHLFNLDILNNNNQSFNPKELRSLKYFCHSLFY